MLPAILLIFIGAGSIALVWSTLNGGPWLFMLFWLAMVLWMGFDGLYRTNYQLAFDDTYLYWKGFLRSGRVLISEIESVQTEWMGTVAVFECARGIKIRVVVLQGFASFLTSLGQTHPSIGAAPGFYARLVERAQLKRKA